MNELGDWLGPAVALIWIVTRVLPRLFKRGRTAEGPPTVDSAAVVPPKANEADDTYGPPPIVPR